MSSISNYELLKTDGTWTERLKYVLSLTDKRDIEKYLKQSLTRSYDDLQMFIFLSISTKNQTNLLEIFQTELLPIKQRIIAGKSWLQFEKDPKIIHDFLVQTINDKNIPRYLKYQILRDLHRNNSLKKSSSFFYDLTCHLTESNHHSQYNIDAHLVPFCTKDQIFNLLSRWSLNCLEQIDSTSAFYSKLVRYQPLIIIDLIKNDLKEKKNHNEEFVNYFQDNDKLYKILVKKEPKEFLRLIIEYLNQLEKHQRILPSIIQLEQVNFFKKTPHEMIELITIVSSNQPGTIKYQSRWDTGGSELGSFSFPRSFSLQNYVRLFFTLYDTCKWSSNYTIRLLQYMLQDRNPNSSLSSMKKEEKWLLDIVINERIGKENFLKKLLKEGNKNTLELLKVYPELTTPLSLHLLSQLERQGIVQAKERLELIRYQLMTQDIFDEFLSLFKQTGSDVNQRLINYPLFFKCALSTNEQFLTKVLQWIEKRFTNEQLTVVETFLEQVNSCGHRFHIEILPNNFQSIETIINIAQNHLQQTANTLRIIINYGIELLQCVEFHSNKKQKENIQAFAIKILRECYSKNDSLSIVPSSISETYPETRRIVADILISDVFPKLVTKCMLTQLDDFLDSCLEKVWRLPQIDLFLKKFFTETLPSSTKLQSAFAIDQNSTMISFFLKHQSTRFERMDQLINKIDKLFFINETIQRIALRSQQYRQFIDKLIEDDKCVTLDKLSNEQSKFLTNLQSTTQNMKLPGLNVDLLNNSSYLLTGKQQEHITRIILNDYLQDKEITNLDKLKSLRVLRRLTHTYHETLQWIDQKQDSPLAVKNSNETSHRSRGAASQPLDDIIICLPATFDLNPQNLIKHLEFLKTKINASNVKYISDAMLNISRKISDEIFLKSYLEFIRNEQFQKLGITANKEVLRLSIEYVSYPSLVKEIIKPIWDNRPHQDIRACLILTLLHFVGKTNSNDDEITIWQILEEATKDQYLPVIQSLFAAHRGNSRWPLTQLKNSSKQIFEIFVNRIQFQVLDHPTSLEARSWAWANIEYEYCHINQLIEKTQQLSIQFDKNANNLWQNAFEKILLAFNQQKISSFDIIIDTIRKIMSRREEVDSKENALDNQHDLPVYHRIQRLLTILNSHINKFDNEKKVSVRSITPIILQFDKTLAPTLATILVKTAQNKEDLEDVLKNLQENLSEKYFERIITQLSNFLNSKDTCPFIQQLSIDEKLHLAEWFIKDKNRPLLVWNLLKDQVFNHSGVDREQCQNLLRQMRQNENLFLQQQAMEYTVPWIENGSLINDDENDDDQMSVSSHSDMS